MDNTLVNAFIPLFTAIVTEAIQIVAEVIKGRQWHEVKWWRPTVITMAVAIVATAGMFLIISKATHCAITNLGWVPYSNDGSGSTITVNPVLGSDCAFQVSFDLEKGRAYVATYKKLEQKFLARWIEGIEFSYSGMGDPNTLELKFFDTADSQYKVVRQHATNTEGETLSVAVPYEALTSAATGSLFKRDGFVLDRMDFTVSNWEGDTLGAGNLIISDIRVILKWYVWLLVFSPILIFGIVLVYTFWQERRRDNPSPT